MLRKRDFATLLLTGALAGFSVGVPVGAAISAPAESTVVVHQPAAATPAEDEPGWDCATMGNMVCGPIMAGGGN